MPFYENVFIARQDVSSAQVETMTDAVGATLQERGGAVASREFWGLRNLTYRIKKNRKGHYVLLNIEAPAEAIQEMERTMRLNEDILRFMTIRIEELPKGLSAMMQRRDEREGREGGFRGDRGDRPRRREFEGGGDDDRGRRPRAETSEEGAPR